MAAEKPTPRVAWSRPLSSWFWISPAFGSQHLCPAGARMREGAQESVLTDADVACRSSRYLGVSLVILYLRQVSLWEGL